MLGYKHPLVGAEPRYVLVKRAEWTGCSYGQLANQAQDAQRSGAGANRPTMVILSRVLRNGTIGADIECRVNGPCWPGVASSAAQFKH